MCMALSMVSISGVQQYGDETILGESRGERPRQTVGRAPETKGEIPMTLPDLLLLFLDV